MQDNSTLAKHDKTRGHKENNILSSIYVPPFQSTLDDIFIEPTDCQTPNQHKAGTNNSNMSDGTMRMCVIPQSAIKGLKLRR